MASPVAFRCQKNLYPHKLSTIQMLAWNLLLKETSKILTRISHHKLDDHLSGSQMNERLEFRDLLEEIVDSYETMVTTITSLIEKVVQKISSLHRDQIQMADRLKDILAKNQSLRRKDFDTMISDIRMLQAQREKEVKSIVKNFCKEEEVQVATLREVISGENPCTVDDFNILKKRMLDLPKERERKLSRMLKNFHQEQEELAAALRKLLEKGSRVKIKDFKAMIKAFSLEHQDEVNGLEEILEEFERVKDKISNQWKKVMDTMGKGEYRTPLAES